MENSHIINTLLFADIGSAMSVTAAGTFCDVASGEIHYSWHIEEGMYWQVDILCYNRNQSVRMMQFWCVCTVFVAYIHSNVHIELNTTNKM